jgi:hypothetical protein
MSDTIYEIVGRIKNLVAKEDIALSPNGVILCNTYALMLKDLYEFSDTLNDVHKEKLNRLLRSKEELPVYVIKLITPKEEENEYEDEDNFTAEDEDED